MLSLVGLAAIFIAFAGAVEFYRDYKKVNK